MPNQNVATRKKPMLRNAANVVEPVRVSAVSPNKYARRIAIPSFAKGFHNRKRKDFPKVTIVKITLVSTDAYMPTMAPLIPK